jgi:hypothetical protein
MTNFSTTRRTVRFILQLALDLLKLILLILIIFKKLSDIIS